MDKETEISDRNPLFGRPWLPDKGRFFFLWENVGPLHADRCTAVAKAMPEIDVVALELYQRSDVYRWEPENGEGFTKVTLYQHGRPRGLTLVAALVAFRRQQGKGTWFLCHYEWPEILFFACWLRLHGDVVFTMGCSKFDDRPRHPLREWLKSWFFIPYRGALSSGIRSRAYFRFLGTRTAGVVGEYNTVSQNRIRACAEQLPAPDGTPFKNRHFTIVARLVPKKNLHVALEAYALHVEAVPEPRMLHLCGDGPLETELRCRASELGIADRVVFHGFLQTGDIARILGSTLTLILPSSEEQFGNVVPEAQAMGLPVILSDTCGARDLLVRAGVNGFVIEPDNPQGLAFFMDLMACNEELWGQMCRATSKFAPRGDVSAFAAGVIELAGSIERNRHGSNV